MAPRALHSTARYRLDIPGRSEHHFPATVFLFSLSLKDGFVDFHQYKPGLRYEMSVYSVWYPEIPHLRSSTDSLPEIFFLPQLSHAENLLMNMRARAHQHYQSSLVRFLITINDGHMRTSPHNPYSLTPLLSTLKSRSIYTADKVPWEATSFKAVKIWLSFEEFASFSQGREETWWFCKYTRCTREGVGIWPVLIYPVVVLESKCWCMLRIMLLTC